jgi:hypothetical protein
MEKGHPRSHNSQVSRPMLSSSPKRLFMLRRRLAYTGRSSVGRRPEFDVAYDPRYTWSPSHVDMDEHVNK